MESNNNKIISKKSIIMITIKKFKEEIALRNNEITERDLEVLKKSMKFHEDLANDEDENDITYLIDCLIYFENLFHSFVLKYNIDKYQKNQ